MSASGVLSRRKKTIVFLGASFLLLICVALPASAAYYVPKLSSFPDLDFSKYPITQQGKIISIPFLAVMIQYAYNLALGLGVITAGVMLVYGGFRYIAGSTVSNVSRAKEIIAHALIGLVLLLGSYTLLRLVNPQLTSLKPLNVEYIPQTPFALAYYESLTTQNPTAPSSPVASKALDKEALEKIAQPSTETTTLPGGDCPFPEVVAGKDKMITNGNLIPFYDAVMSRLHGATFPERVKEVADYAVKCKVNLGSCGQTMGRIWGMAGVQDNSFLHKKSNEDQYGLKIFNMNVKPLPKPIPYVLADLRGLHCNNDCREKDKKSECIESKSGAVARARQIAEAKGGAEYPDAYVDQLQPGDWFQFYTANRDCAGNHSVIFVGWKDNSGIAITVTGEVRTDKKPNAVVSYANYCLKKACGQYYPIVGINRPKPELLKDLKTQLSD